MGFEILYVIFIVMTVLNYIFLDIKVDKLKKENIEKDKIISAFSALDKAISKLNAGFKDHERRINNIEKLLLSENESFEKPKKESLSCTDCEHFWIEKFGFGKHGCDAVSMLKMNNEQLDIACGCPFYVKKANPYENVVYANNVKVDISSKRPIVYKFNGSLLTHEDYAKRIMKLCLDGGISFADANALLERIKQ